MVKKQRKLAKSPIRKLMKENGAKIVGADALELVISSAENYIERLTKKSQTLSYHANRKKISKPDVELALTLINK